MQINFKQGIIQYQTDMNSIQDVFRYNSGLLSIGASNKPFTYSISMELQEDVLFTIGRDIPNVWSGISPSVRTWFGFKHHPLTGEREAFTTIHAPHIGPEAPLTSYEGQFWYDTTVVLH